MSRGPIEPFDLFSNGTEYDRWMARNCERCTKSGDVSEAGSSPCELFEAIANNACGDAIPEPLAVRLGYCEGPCPELVAGKPIEVTIVHGPGGIMGIGVEPPRETPDQKRERERAALAAWNAGRPIKA